MKNFWRKFLLVCHSSGEEPKPKPTTITAASTITTPLATTPQNSTSTSATSKNAISSKIYSTEVNASNEWFMHPIKWISNRICVYTRDRTVPYYGRIFRYLSVSVS